VTRPDEAGTVPAAGQHALDTARLADYLKARIDGFRGTLTADKFEGGQSNPTFMLRLDGEPRYVLRRKPLGNLLPSAHAVDREYRILTALRDTDVPVPRTHLLCEDDSVIGSMFYVMDYKKGRNLWDPTLPGMAPAERAAIYDEMNRVIAALHRVDYVAVGLADYGKPGNYFARQIGRWSKQYRASETERIEAMENLIAWLPDNIPAGDETSLVHGDYRLDNMIFHPTEARVIGVLDWELSTLGHPLADFGYHVMAWRLTPDQYRGLGGVDLAPLGIPDEQAYLRLYCQRTGRDGVDPRQWEFSIIYNIFRIASIRQGIMKRALDGTASSRQALEMGALARSNAEAAWRAVEKQFL
jgi:aminoglycoside phosphotransferase (APT) family kinase protein